MTSSSKSPEEIWELAKEEPYGIAVSDCDLELLERKLKVLQAGDPELQGYYFARRGDELHIIRARNTGVIRADGDFAPVEE